MFLADESNSVLRQSRVWMVIIKLFPEMVKTLGVSSLDIHSQCAHHIIMSIGISNA